MKLFELKEDQGELDPKDEKQFRKYFKIIFKY